MVVGIDVVGGQAGEAMVGAWPGIDPSYALK
jgi:hypothetical protein